MEHDKILELFKRAQSSTTATREEASQMLVFGRINAWDDDVGRDVLTEFRGNFPLVKAKRNHILSELWSNPIDVEFKPKDGASPEAAEILNGMYRHDMQASEEAFKTATTDQVDSGFGAWRLCTQYESKFNDLDNSQIIRREPINEANNVVYFDANAKRQDKSDARWCIVVSRFTPEGWEDYCNENGIDYDEHENPASVIGGNKTSVVYWRSDQKEVKVGEMYSKRKKRERVFIYEDPMGQTRAYYQSKIKDVLQELMDSGYRKVGEKFKDRWVVTKTIFDGEQVIKEHRVAGEHIPVIPVYADWSVTEGRELWHGIYHDAQDPQRLHNMLMSYMADIVAKGPREKPIFYPGQIQGFEYMYHLNGMDNNYPYMLQNEVSPATGEPYPAGPVGTLQPPQMPQSISALLGLVRQAADDVTGSSMDSNQMLNSQVTDEQIEATARVQSMETFVFQDGLALAMRQDGRVYASMASELYDVPREVVVSNPDGTESTEMVMEAVVDFDTGETVVLNDLTAGAFEVYTDIGPKYSTLKEQARREMRSLATEMQGTPEGEMMLLTYLNLLEGPNTEHIRKHARQRLVLSGFMEPETDEEIAMVQQAAQQPAEPSSDMVLAQAEMEKAKADQANAMARQQDSQTRMQDTQVKRFEAETRRAKVQIDAEKAGVDIQKSNIEQQGMQLENVKKFMEALGARQ